MAYVIMRGRLYVAPAGQPSSYVRDIREARAFATREAAERERCPDNERVVAMYDELPTPREG